MKKEEIKKIVKKGYSKIARKNASCCTPLESCCSDGAASQNISRKIGYTDKDLEVVPEEANLGLGCGNPVALASLKEGEIVLDLGSGAGFDCFLAAQRVGKKGRVIGVDITPEMIEKARQNARQGQYENVEFRLGEIEKLPVADNSVDVIISNCVINLSPEKEKVFSEAFRVLRPGGRMMIADIVLLKPLPDFIQDSLEAYVGCLSGAIMRNDYLKLIKKAGFSRVKVIDENPFPLECMANDQTAKALIDKLNISHEVLKEIENSVVSIKIYGFRP